MPFRTSGTMQILSVIWLLATTCVSTIIWLDDPGLVQRASSNKTSANKTEDFAEQTSEFFENFCLSCHGDVFQESDLRFDNLGHNLQDPDISGVWKRVLEQVLYSEMPPLNSADIPDAEERQNFVELVEAELSRYGNGLNINDKMRLPEFGNFVDNDLLFDGSIQEKPFTPSRLWRQRPDIYRRLWGKQYGRKHRLSVKIGGTEREGEIYKLQRGPHTGKAITSRYFADERFANPFYEYVHQASGFSDYATIVADQASLEALLINAETMSEILTLGTKVNVVTEVKSKDSKHGNNHGGFVGGVETISHERRGPIPIAFKRIMETNDSVNKEDFRKALEIAFSLFLRRLPSEDDLQHYWQNVFLKNAELGNTHALQAVLTYVAISPEFVYRMEMGLGAKDEFGRRMLSPQELVYAIQYAFQDTPPFGVEEFESEEAYQKNSPPLIRKAMIEQNGARYAKNSWLAEQMKAGKLKTKEDVETAVRKFLGGGGGNLNPTHNRPITSVKNPRILQFFREFFGYHKAHTVFKDTDKFANREGFSQFHDHSAIRQMYDTDALILHILETDKNVIHELLTTNKVFVSYWDGTNPPEQVKRAGNKKKYIANHDSQSYNLNPFQHEHPRNEPIMVPQEERCGILTQPSWLVAHSGNFDNDPVRRGKWIREKLLGGNVLDIPITVDAQIPDDETKTLRERFHVVRDDYCWRCHRKMNPLGMPFEAFNHVGRFREFEKGKPVDTRGNVSFTGVEGLDKEVANVRQMMEHLAKSDRVRQSFLRHMFRFWMGRNEMLSDSQTLIAMEKAYQENEGSFQEALVALLTSDSFLYRK